LITNEYRSKLSHENPFVGVDHQGADAQIRVVVVVLGELCLLSLVTVGPILVVRVAGYHEHRARRRDIAQRRFLSDERLPGSHPCFRCEDRGAYGWPRVLAATAGPRHPRSQIVGATLMQRHGRQQCKRE
jgi:hypothetical protein